MDGFQLNKDLYSIVSYMSHISVYLPDELEEKVRKAAQAEGSNVSRWIASKVTLALANTWRPEFVALAGAFPDFPDVRELREAYPEDSPRASAPSDCNPG